MINRTKLQSLLKNRKFLFELSFLALSLVVIGLSLSPVLRHPGWPQNHEATSFMYRTEIYSEHFKRGDIFPIWASSDAYDMGTPLPLFYQKTFYYVSGIIFLVTSSVKLTILASLCLFMLVGAYGMRFCLQKLTEHKIIILLVPQAFLLSNYSFTDWLVRGAMAEFTALMLVPWIIWWCLSLLKDKEFSLYVVPILFLLVNAHNITALFALVPLSSAYLIFLLREKKAGFNKTIKKALFSAELLGLLLAIELILQKVFLKIYDPSKITQAGYLATNHFLPLREYFYAPSYQWLKDWTQFSVQIDFAIWVPIAIGILALVSGLSNKSFRNKINRLFLFNPLFLFLAVNIAIFMILQLSATKPLYEHIKTLQFIQFPWRLLVYITPMGILVVAYMASKLRINSCLTVLVIVWLASFLFLSPILKSFKYTFLNPDKILANAKGGLQGRLMGIGEYLPRIYDNGNTIGSIQTLSIYENLYRTNRSMEVIKGGPCELNKKPNLTFEPSAIILTIKCQHPAKVALPISYNEFTIINDLGTNQIVNYSRIYPSDPRIIIDVSVNSREIKADLPKLSSGLRKLL